MFENTMLRTHTRNAFYLSLGFALSLTSGGLHADDTEIYFSGRGSDEAVRPNVLFILDTSGSMNIKVPGSGVNGGANKTRWEVVQDVFKQLLSEAEDVNIGVMPFTNDQGASVLFPIRYLKDNVYSVPGERVTGPDRLANYSATINSGANDGEENLADNAVVLNDVLIDVLNINARTSATTRDRAFANRLGNSSQFREWVNDPPLPAINGRVAALRSQVLRLTTKTMIGLRFNNVDGAGGAGGDLRNRLITDAYIRFHVDTANANPAEFQIRGEDADASTRLRARNNNLSSREMTDGMGTGASGDGSVAWSLPASTTGEEVRTPNLRTIVQEIVSRGCASAPATTLDTNGCSYTNSDMAFFFTTTSGTRDFRSAISRNPEDIRPELVIEYQEDEISVDTVGDQQRVGLRFENIRIPRGARIHDAKLIFTPAESQSQNTTWDIDAENTGDSAAFAVADGNLSGRTLTGNPAKWRVPTFRRPGADANGDEVSYPVETEDNSTRNLKAVLQEIVNRQDWCGGNAISFFITAATNQPLALRRFQSFEANSAHAVRFSYSYEPIIGCFMDTATAQVNPGSDDAEQYDSTVNTSRIDLVLGASPRVGQDQTVGLRFQDINIPQGSTINQAHLSFRAQDTASTAASFTIRGIDADDVATFSNLDDDISDRPTTAAAADWTPTNWDAGNRYQTTDISAVVQEIVNRTGWTRDNNMGFVIAPGRGTRAAYSYDGDPASGPRLSISYEALAVPRKTVRERLAELIDQTGTFGQTPILGAMYEALRYWRGESMVYGDIRQFPNSRVSHPGSYCIAEGDCNGANVNARNFQSRTGRTDRFGVWRRFQCSPDNPASPQCNRTEIVHQNDADKTRYISPFSPVQECGNNYQVLMTDGEANIPFVLETNPSRRREAEQALVQERTAEVHRIIGRPACYANSTLFDAAAGGGSLNDYTEAQRCVADMAEALATRDQSETLPNDQFVKTYTVGFALPGDNIDTTNNIGRIAANNARRAKRILRHTAELGEGRFFEASDAAKLTEVFNTILSDVRSDPTSFVSPALATNAFNRLLSRNEVYFGLFTPALSKSWYGNIKKYGICIDSSAGCALGQILDASGQSATDPNTDRFRENARSFWASTDDGRETTRGGAGAEITDYRRQTLYTDANSGGRPAAGTRLDAGGFRFQPGTVAWNDASLSALRASICPTPSIAADSECEARMNWLLGKKITTDAENDVNATQRWSVNDVLHSSPVVITYGGQEGNFYDKIIYGTNDGMVHFVDGATGTEDWRFLPQDFWAQQQAQYLAAEGQHLYGVDVTPTLRVLDNNGNGLIEPGAGDLVHAFFATRRGGRYIYALDVTADGTGVSAPEVVPAFRWRIQGGSGDYARLGLTFSQPQLGTIAITDSSGNDVNKTVLIFGGGYDEALDANDAYAPAAGASLLGNAIFIVDPDNGDLILSISGPGSGADIQVPDMRYSIPSRVRMLDSDGDALIDRLYVGDTGGQLWRVDLDRINLGSNDPQARTVVGKLAQISNPTRDRQRRWFFEPPTVVQVRDEVYSANAEYDYVFAGTGARPHPLNNSVNNRIYAFRDTFTAKNALFNQDRDNDNVAEAGDTYPKVRANRGTPLGDRDLVDVSTAPLDATSAQHRAAAGWYYNFDRAARAAGELASGDSSGEKVLSAPTVTAGAMVLTTFKPDTTTVDGDNPCLGGVGNATAYNFNILSAGAVLDWDGDGNINLADRKQALGGGIPSDVVPVFTKEGVVGIVGVEGGASQLGVLSELPRFTTYFYEEE